MGIRLRFAVLFLFTIFGPPGAFANEPATLGSGKSIEIIAIGPIAFAHGDSALMLKYKTSIPLTDMASLRKEATEVWDRFVVDVEHANLQQAIVSANEPEEGGVVSHNAGYNFIFEKKDGSWRMLEGKGKAPLKLDESFIKEFYDRVDSVYEHNEMNAFLLYFANNWSGSFSGGSGPSETIDRMRLAATSHQALSQTKDFQHQRKILKIKIAADGASAEVESQEIEQGIMNGNAKKEVEHSLDTIEVQGSSVVFTKTVTSGEDQNKK